MQDRTPNDDRSDAFNPESDAYNPTTGQLGENDDDDDEVEEMTNDKLKRCLKSIGKAQYVKNFDIFKIYFEGQCNEYDRCVKELVERQVSNESGARRRCGCARQIFKAGMEYEALEIVIESPRVEDEIENQARSLFKKYHNP